MYLVYTLAMLYYEVLIKLTPCAGDHCLDYDHIPLLQIGCEFPHNLPKGLSKSPN
jgi:hypothetical protein